MQHEKVGHTEQGLWHHKGMQLPAYIEHIANDLIARGMPEPEAIATAVAQCKRWAAGGEGVKPETRAKAAAAIAEWEALKAASHAAAEKGHGRTGKVTAYTRSFPLEDISIRAGGDGRTVDAYAAVFNTPAKVRDEDGRYEEVIDPGAFTRTLEHARRAKGGASFPVLFNHGLTLYGTPSERYSVPIGVSEEVRTDGNGLFTRSRFHRTQAAEEVLEAIREGSITAYSFQGDFLRSDPLIPRGGFRPDREGRLATVRRTEATLREYGPGTFAVYPDAAIVGVRAEQVAAMAHAGFTRDEVIRFVDAMYQAGTPLDPPAPDTPGEGPGPVTEDPPPARHSVRPPREELVAQRAKFLIKHGGGRTSA